MMRSPLQFAHRPLLFSTFVTLVFIVSVVAIVIVQKTAAQPLLQEAVGAAGRAVIGLGALILLGG